MIKAVVYDCREGSPTYGEVNEFFLGDNNPILLKIPVGTMHGYKTVGVEPSLLINFPTRALRPQGPGRVSARRGTARRYRMIGRSSSSDMSTSMSEMRYNVSVRWFV